MKKLIRALLPVLALIALLGACAAEPPDGADSDTDTEQVDAPDEAAEPELGVSSQALISEYDWNVVLTGSFKSSCDRKGSYYEGGGSWCIRCRARNGNYRTFCKPTCAQGWNNCNGQITCSNYCP